AGCRMQSWYHSREQIRSSPMSGTRCHLWSTLDWRSNGRAFPDLKTMLNEMMSAALSQNLGVGSCRFDNTKTLRPARVWLSFEKPGRVASEPTPRTATMPGTRRGAQTLGANGGAAIHA